MTNQTPTDPRDWLPIDADDVSRLMDAATEIAVYLNENRPARALRDVFVSPNEADRNLEPANVVDGLFAIARGLHAVAQAIQEAGRPVRDGRYQDSQNHEF